MRGRLPGGGRAADRSALLRSLSRKRVAARGGVDPVERDARPQILRAGCLGFIDPDYPDAAGPPAPCVVITLPREAWAEFSLVTQRLSISSGPLTTHAFFLFQNSELAE